MPQLDRSRVAALLEGEQTAFLGLTHGRASCSPLPPAASSAAWSWIVVV